MVGKLHVFILNHVFSEGFQFLRALQQHQKSFAVFAPAHGEGNEEHAAIEEPRLHGVLHLGSFHENPQQKTSTRNIPEKGINEANDKKHNLCFGLKYLHPQFVSKTIPSNTKPDSPVLGFFFDIR